MVTIDVALGTIAFFGDIGCPWAHVASHRLHVTRERLGLQDAVRFDVRAFPLELINEMPTPKLILDAELPVAGALEPEAGWQVWQAPAHEWPVTVVPALEAVEATKEQGLRASEVLDRALRVALFGQSRCISMHHVILEIAAETGQVDTVALKEALVAGRARRRIEEYVAIARSGAVKQSPHLFAPDGTNHPNPGITLHWVHHYGVGFPVVDADDSTAVYEDLLRRAADTRLHVA